MMTWFGGRRRAACLVVAVSVLAGASFGTTSSQERQPGASEPPPTAVTVTGVDAKLREAQEVKDDARTAYALMVAAIEYKRLRRLDDAVSATREAADTFIDPVLRWWHRAPTGGWMLNRPTQAPECPETEAGPPRR